MIIVPSILTNNPEDLREMLRICDGLVTKVQIDIVDGVFFNNKTIFPDELKNIETDLLIDYHLMVKEPVNWVEKCVLGNGDQIIGQVEMMKAQSDFLGKTQEVGLKVGLGLDVETELERLEKSILSDCDAILVMNYPAGIGGQEFQPRSLAKIKRLAKLRKKTKSSFQIISDGGVNAENIKSLFQAGCDEVVVGKSLFKGNFRQNLDELRLLSSQ